MALLHCALSITDVQGEAECCRLDGVYAGQHAGLLLSASIACKRATPAMNDERFCGVIIAFLPAVMGKPVTRRQCCIIALVLNTISR